MTDIAKLKQEAEEARKAAIKEIRYTHTSDFYDPSAIADSLIAATIAQIALQAAEKEAEAQAEKYPDSEGWSNWNGNWMPVPDMEPVDVINAQGIRGMGYAKCFYWGANDLPERIVRWRRMGQVSAQSANPAPIADDTWIKWEGGECPIPGIENWEWKGRDGRISKEVKYLAEKLRWRHCDSCSDIIAYRVIGTADRVGEP